MQISDELMLFNLLGHLGHGIVHGFISAMYHSDSDGVGAQHITGIEQLTMEEDQIENVKQVFIGIGDLHMSRQLLLLHLRQHNLRCQMRRRNSLMLYLWQLPRSFP